MRTPYDNRLSDHLDDLDPPQRRLNADERARILARACAKAGLDAPEAPPAPDTGEPPLPRLQAVPGGKARRAPRRIGALVAAVAAVCALTVGVAAVGPALLQLGKGEIGFFDTAPDPATAENALDAPHGSFSAAAQAMADHTVTIGQTCESNGLSMTLESVSMDTAAMNLFLTIRKEGLIPDLLDRPGGIDYFGQSELSALLGWMPTFDGDIGQGPLINGQAVCSASYQVQDFYRVDDDTLQVWVHYALTDLPQGESLTVDLDECHFALGVEGSWSFTFTLDAAQVRAHSLNAQPGIYDIGQTYTADLEGKVVVDAPLRLRRLAFGPVGGVMVTDFGDDPAMLEPDNTTVTGTTWGFSPQLLLMTDNTGKELYAVPNKILYSGNEPSIYDVTAPADGATELTLTPVVHKGAYDPQERILTTEQMKAGVTVATTDVSGFTVRNYKVENGSISYEMVPYGLSNANEIIPDDDDLVSTINGHSAMSSATVDPKTGVWTCRLDYYAATDEELEAIASWRYYFEPGYEADTAHSLTLPLSPAD